MPQLFTSAPARRSAGFTLVELVMVIVIMGVIFSTVSIFIKGPIDAYISMGRRAALTDVADTTVRRIARDLRRALPNSVRVPNSACLEFIPTKTGGRYRAQEKVPGDDTSLDFTKSDSVFNMIGDNATFANIPLPAEQIIAPGDLIVVYNQQGSSNNAFVGDNYSPVSAVGTVSANETPITITAKQFLLVSASYRFHVVPATEQLVTYQCSGTNLYRTVSSLPAPSALCPSSGSIIATNVNCAATSFTSSGPDLSRNSLISMVLNIQDSSGSEAVTLQHEVHVDNTP